MTMSESAAGTAEAWLDPGRRHDAVLLFDVTNGNPNGDPDAGNQPRTNPLDMRGLVSDVAIKRKIRNFVAAARPADGSADGDTEPNARFKIYVEEGVALNARHARAYSALGLTPKRTSREEQMTAQQWMCDNFFDVRMFGAVMSTGDHNCGQCKGPVQVSFASTIDPIFPLDETITRVAVTRTQELEKMLSEEGGGKDREMGRKAIVPYGLYRTHVYYSPYFGERTGVTSEDLGLLWQALQMMWDLDRSSARTDIGCRGLYVFSHASKLGDAPAHKLLDKVRIHKRDDVEYPSSFEHYVVSEPQSGEVIPRVSFSGNLV